MAVAVMGGAQQPEIVGLGAGLHAHTARRDRFPADSGSRTISAYTSGCAPPIAVPAITTAACAAAGIPLRRVLPHAGYLINLGAPDAAVVRKSQAAFLDEFDRCRRLGLRGLNLHPGSHLGKMEDAACMDQIAAFLNRAIAEIPDVTVVYECTAGQGSHLGHTFAQLAGLIDRIDDKSRVGVCLDTCHLYAAGYDLTTAAAYERTMREFEQVVGLRYLAGAHLNDSKTALGSRVDRHASLGKGTMGWEPFRLLMNDPRFDEIPLITETVDPDLWAEELTQLRALQTSNNESWT